MNNTTIVLLIVLAILVAFGAIGGCLWGAPKYRIYKQDLRGQAELREAEWTKKVQIEDAKAALESAELKAQAEIVRAKGVAESNKIIGDSLQGKDEYLRYLWIQGLQDGSSEVIYIPTEAGLPILEARNR